MEFLDKTEMPLQAPSEATQHIIDTYSISVFKSIFVKIMDAVNTDQPASLPIFNEHEICFMKKYCNTQSKEVLIETPKECIIGNGEKQLKVKLDILQKMKEKKLMTESVNEESPTPSPRGTGYAPEFISTSNKNAYEIRLDILKEAISCSSGNPERALKIAENFYKFVENKRRL